jgi:hypothetical protein
MTGITRNASECGATAARAALANDRSGRVSGRWLYGGALLMLAIFLAASLAPAGPVRAQDKGEGLFGDNEGSIFDGEGPTTWRGQRFAQLLHRNSRKDEVGKKLARKRLETIIEWQRWREGGIVDDAEDALFDKLDEKHEHFDIRHMKAGGKATAQFDISRKGLPVTPYFKKDESVRKKRIRAIRDEITRRELILQALEQSASAKPHRKQWPEFIKYLQNNLKVEVKFRKRREIVTLALNSPTKETANVVGNLMRVYIDYKQDEAQLGEATEALRQADTTDEKKRIKENIEQMRKDYRDRRISLDPVDPDLVYILLYDTLDSYDKEIVKRAARETNFDPRNH